MRFPLSRRAAHGGAGKSSDRVEPRSQIDNLSGFLVFFQDSGWLRTFGGTMGATTYPN